MDLNTFTVKDTSEVVIKHRAFMPGAEPVFVLSGPNHPASKAAILAKSEAAATGRTRTEPAAVLTEWIAAHVVEWRNVSWEGKEMECTPENVLKILTTPALEFIVDQLYRALQADELFYVA